MRETPPAIDITMPIGTEMSVYPGDAPPIIRRLSSIGDGSPLTTSEITLNLHLGTHVDAPAHFIPDGRTVDQFGMEHFCGRALVIDMTGRERITGTDVRALAIEPRRHILLKTRNSELLGRGEFDPRYCTLTAEAAAELMRFDPLSIGFDYHSLDPPAPDAFPAHHLIARAGLPAFVCLDLRNAPPGEYFFCGLPLKIEAVEAAPVRAVLFRMLLKK